MQLTQYYVNQTGHEVEAEYVFPIDSKAAVSGFEVEIDGLVVTGVVKEKVKARQTYEAAIAAGDSAQLLEQLRDDVFRMVRLVCSPHMYIESHRIESMVPHSNRFLEMLARRRELAHAVARACFACFRLSGISNRGHL